MVDRLSASLLESPRIYLSTMHQWSIQWTPMDNTLRVALDNTDNLASHA